MSKNFIKPKAQGLKPKAKCLIIDDVMIASHKTYRISIVNISMKRTCQLLALGFKPWALSLVEDNGVEPLTPCVQGRCSGQLS